MRKLGVLALAGLALWLAAGGPAAAQEKVQFLSFADNGPGRRPTTLDGYLFRAAGPGRHPAIVFLHGCFGMFDRPNVISAVERQWAARLNRAGEDVLMVDSNGPRGIKETCSPESFQLPLYLRRINDAYGALFYLQRQPFIAPRRIALMGWDAGGGVVLLTIARDNPTRPSSLPEGGFRAAVALYPALCANRFFTKPWADSDHPTWTSNVPLLILDGGRDVWTPARQCREFVQGARQRGAMIVLRIYRRAYHAFDAPGLKPIRFPQYAQPHNVVPILGTDPGARRNALRLVPRFLRWHLGR
jgi:dienelactone hydrolase